MLHLIQKGRIWQNSRQENTRNLGKMCCIHVIWPSKLVRNAAVLKVLFFFSLKVYITFSFPRGNVQFYIEASVSEA